MESVRPAGDMAHSAKPQEERDKTRRVQKRTPQWTIGKNFDATGAFGPAIVSADELAPGATGLRIQSRLDGEVMQDANTDDMIFGVAETISLLAQCMTLEPGDTIVMGTPARVGQSRTPPVWMKAGDVIEARSNTYAPCAIRSSLRSPDYHEADARTA